MTDRPRDPRGEALADFLRHQAEAMSLSADVTGHLHLADVGMALLDAAGLAQRMRGDDTVLMRLSEAGCFEPMPDGGARFVSSGEIRRALLRPISGDAEAGAAILGSVVLAAGRP